MIDFIHCHHTHFTGGIYWINCRTPQLKAQSLKYIKDALRLEELSELPDIDSQPSLVVLESPDQETLEDENSEWQWFLTKANNHFVIVMSNKNIDIDSLQNTIECKFHRGSTRIEVCPLSTIHARMRLVHSVLKTRDLVPSDKHRELFFECADGDPDVVNVLCAFLEADPLTNFTHCTKEQILHHIFAKLGPNDIKLLQCMLVMESASTQSVLQNIESMKHPNQNTSAVFNTLKAMKLLLPVPKPIVYHPAACCEMEEQMAGDDRGHFYVPQVIRTYINRYGKQ
jgi:hypothetical protein